MIKFKILTKTNITMQDLEEDTFTIFKSVEKPTGKPLKFSRNGYTRTVKGILLKNWVFFYHKQIVLKDGEHYVIPLRK